MNTSEMAKLYDTILSIPGMNETVKVDFKLSRKMIMLLEGVINRGLTAKDDSTSSKLVDAIGKDSLQELTAFSQELLQRAGLTELSEKLKAFHTEK